MSANPPATFTVIAGSAALRQVSDQARSDPSSAPRMALMWTLAGMGGVPETFGRHTLRVWIARAVLRILALVMMSVSLALPWWNLSFSEGGATGSGGAWVTNSCDPVFGCTGTSVWDDKESVLKTGQYALIGCYLGAIITAWLQRLARRLAFVRAVTSGRGQRWLLDGDAGDGSGGAPSTAAASAAAAALKARWGRRMAALRVVLAVDVATALLAVVGLAVFEAQTVAWFNQYVTPPLAGTGISATISFSGPGAALGALAVLASMLVASVSVATMVLARRQARLLQEGGFQPLPGAASSGEAAGEGPVTNISV